MACAVVLSRNLSKKFIGESVIRTGNEYSAALEARQGRPRKKCCSQSAVESSKCVGQHERHEQNARSEYKHVPGVAQIEAADPADEQDASSRHRKRSQCDARQCGVPADHFRKPKYIDR